MSFGAPQWFWGLLVLPALVLLFFHAERKSTQRLRNFVSARLLPALAGTVNRFRRALRFGLLLLGVAFVLISLAQPRWGYTFQDVKRKGIDLLIAVDTSRSMLSNDVPPNRLERVKLATQDLINELQGDRVGLIAFAGRAFVQAPLTIDYDAVIESIHDLDTKTIPEGGTNISEAITLAERTYGKSAVGNRALVIFTDGEELSGDAVKTAKAAADAGVRIFTVGIGTPEGSLIPLSGGEEGTSFVKDSKGQVVKSKLDEKRLREIAQTTGGFYLHLENGPRTMQQLVTEGITKMQAGEIDERLSRQPIERYEWPLGAAMIALSMSMFIGERKRVRVAGRVRTPMKLATAATGLMFFFCPDVFGAGAGLDFYRNGKYEEAYRSFQDDLKNHPNAPAKDKIQFDAGAAAYQLHDYDKALQAFSDSLLTKDVGLQESSHFNAGRTLEERADMAKSDDKALKDLTNAQTHYEDVLKLNPKNAAAKANLDAVKEKIERLKKHQKEKPTPPPQQQKQQKKQNDQSQDQQNQQQQQSSQQDRQQQQQDQQDQQQQSQSQNQSGTGQNQKRDEKDQSQAKNDQQKKEQPQPGESPSPSPGQGQQQKGQQPSPSSSPSPGEGKNDAQDRQSSPGQKKAEESPRPGSGKDASPSPSPGDGDQGEGASPSLTPADSPRKKFAGDVKGAAGEKPEKPPEKNAEIAEAEAEKEGQLSERQAEALLQSMKDEEARVQLDERRVTRRVYNDW
jgi:Ca-activated chloride channel family protein